MEVPLLLQFSIALFMGMVAATLVPPVRRSIPRPIEIALWVALVVACAIGVISITNPNARELTTSAVWGVDQIINTLVGLLGAGMLGWMVDHRFTIATCAGVVFAIDVLALAMLRTYRQARAWLPQVRLGEWMELPRASTATERVALPYALDELNRKSAAAFAVAGAALLASLVNFAIWARDILLPRQAERFARAAAAGRVESRARLESLSDTAAQLQYAARSWYTAAGAPAVNGLAAKAVRTARSEPAGLVARRLADIHVLLNARAMGVPVEEEEADAARQTDRLAS